MGVAILDRLIDTQVPRKLKAKEVVDVKKELIVAQGFKCPLCGSSLRNRDFSKIALDHCHDSGYIRGVLCMGCNRVEGIVKKAITQWGRTTGNKAQVSYIRNLSKYLELHGKTPIKLFYHLHKTEEQQLELKKKRAAKKRKENK